MAVATLYCREDVDFLRRSSPFPGKFPPSQFEPFPTALTLYDTANLVDWYIELGRNLVTTCHASLL